VLRVFNPGLLVEGAIMAAHGPGALKRALRTREDFAISAGAMISSGLFVLPAIVYPQAGPSIILAYLLASVFVIPAMLSKAELATAMPRSGGVYFFVTRSFGVLFGIFTGFASWFSLSLKSAFALLGLGVLLAPLIPGISPRGLAVGATVCFAVLNLFSVKETGRLQVLLVVALLACLAFLVVGGIPGLDGNRYVPFMPGGPMRLLTVTGMIFVSFGGLTKIASVAEEVKDPGKAIPKGMFLAFGVVTLCYVLAVLVAVGLLTPEEFAGTRMPLSLAAAKIYGRPGFVVLAGAAVIAFLTTGNAGLLAASRDPMAMSRDNLVPKQLAAVSKRFQTPVLSVAATAVFMIAGIVFFSLEDLVKVASTMKLLMFIFVNVAVIFMRASRVVSYKPVFRSPGYPYVQIAGVLIYAFLISRMGTVPLVITGGFFVLSILWYFVYARKHVAPTSAFVRMVGNLTDQELVAEHCPLEGELLSILRERDEVEDDRFDTIIRKAIVLDYGETVSRDVLFRDMSEALAKRWSLDPRSIEDKLKVRELDSSTLIYPGVAIPHAIPHVIVDGHNLFDIVLVRNKFGITWNEEGEVVYTAFGMVGSKDERNFHLKALMFIAQVLQDPEFHSLWTRARTEQEFRSVILVARRRRK